ncbi:MAG: DUF2813 domain-containing protein [Succinivibrio sp.]
MFLEKAKVANFRGIRKITVDFEDGSTVLIGENHWGKTSLLRVLWMVLGQGETLCNFSHDDLYVPIPIDTTSRIKADDLVEKVTGRKSISFDETYQNVKNADSSDRKSENKADTPALKNEKLFLDELGKFIDESEPLDTAVEEESFDKTDAHIRVDLFFRESVPSGPGEADPELKDFWYYDSDGVYRIHYQIVAFFNENEGRFVTYHNLLNKQKMAVKRDEKQVKAILALIRYNPVFRLRDSRMDGQSDYSDEQSRENKLKAIMAKVQASETVSGEYIGSVINLFGDFLDKYFANYTNYSGDVKQPKKTRNLDDIVKRPISLESLSSIKTMLQEPGFNKSKALVSFIAINMLLSQGDRKISPDSRPIIIFEDIESRFHPSLLLSFWSLIEPTETQKIITTNSGDLLSAVSLESLRRLHRRLYDTYCFKIDPYALSYEDLRRIAFHIRLNRPMALFARTWILVEGETEVWIITQIASILGISLPCEGIRIIEFAQCGLKPLIKMAKQLGINFHVLTDGDEAGQKYSDITKAFISKKKIDRYLTTLPQKDIEHYLYTQGYERTFRLAAGITNQNQLKKGFNMDRIIELAIRKKSKPGLALVLVDAIQKRGLEGVPVIFARLLQTVRELGSENYL